MRKLCLLLGAIICFAVSFTSCSKSPEQKAKDLVEQEIKKRLYFPESYDLADAKVDSAFAPYDSPEFIELTSKLVELSNEISSAQEEVKNQERSVSIWSNPYGSTYAQTELNQARAELSEAQAKEEKAMNEAQKIADKMKQMMNKKSEFIGYKAIISYRAKNNSGNIMMDNVFALFDKNVEKLTFICENSDYEQYSEAIKELQDMTDSE